MRPVELKSVYSAINYANFVNQTIIEYLVANFSY